MTTADGPSRRSVRRWWVVGWAVLVVAGGTATLCLQAGDDAGEGQEHLRWERSTPTAGQPDPDPDPCPSLTGGDSGRRADCAYWERS
ncbi:hypothetical protein [Streptomyces sp. NPDC048603]|uniref:hypothetical protein n=1 Tax=Streptomyces sp. NPDC048603 TaxID=3365577 RepID=UPI003719AC1A